MSPTMIWKRVRRSTPKKQSGGSLRRRYVFSTGGVAIALLVVVTAVGSVAPMPLADPLCWSIASSRSGCGRSISLRGSRR
jgi:hypothetical protein